jgi:hypothetical protein
MIRIVFMDKNHIMRHTSQEFVGFLEAVPEAHGGYRHRRLRAFWESLSVPRRKSCWQSLFLTAC